MSPNQGCQIEISEIRDFLLEIRILSGHFFFKNRKKIRSFSEVQEIFIG